MINSVCVSRKEHSLKKKKKRKGGCGICLHIRSHLEVAVLHDVLVVDCCMKSEGEGVRRVASFLNLA